MALLRAGFCSRLQTSFSFSVRNVLKSNIKNICATAPSPIEETTAEPMSKRKQKRLKKEKDMKIRSDYYEEVRHVVIGFREERIKNKELRLAAEGEKKRLIEKEKFEEKRVIESVKIENERLEELRIERLEIEEFKQKFRRLKRAEDYFKRKERLKALRTEKVKQAIEESKEFVTMENLDEKISQALENETYYNFALTPFGERIYSTAPPGNESTDLPGPAAFIFPNAYYRRSAKKD